MQNSLFNLAWPIFDCLDPAPNLYKSKINLSWQIALSRIAWPQVQPAKCGRKCPKFTHSGLKKLGRCWTHARSFIRLSVYVKHDLCRSDMSFGVVSPDCVIIIKALFSSGLKKKEKKHTPSWKCQQQWFNYFRGRVSPFFPLTLSTALMKPQPVSIFSFWKISIARTTKAIKSVQYIIHSCFTECGCCCCVTQMKASVCQRGWSWSSAGGWIGWAWHGSGA